MESEIGQLAPASLQDIRFVFSSGDDQMVVVLNAERRASSLQGEEALHQGEQVPEMGQELDNVGT